MRTGMSRVHIAGVVDGGLMFAVVSELCAAVHLHFVYDLDQRLAKLPVGATFDEDASVENPWGQRRYTVRPTALVVLDRAPSTAISYIPRRHKVFSNGLCASVASSAAPPTVSDTAIASLLQVKTHLYFDLPSSPYETIRTAQQLSSEEASGRMRSLLKPTSTVIPYGALPGDVASRRGIRSGQRLKQGCVLEPILFILMLSATPIDAYRDERPGIRVAYRTNGQLLNHRRNHFQSHVLTTTDHELLFFDECALSVTSVGDMRRSMDLLSAACNNVGLVINTKETVPIHQPPSDAAYASP
ncbi:hypothetical protein SprV_0501906000 [Sparganum proliferum]